MSHGEKIGTIQQTGSPVKDTVESYKRVATGRLILHSVISNVLAGVDKQVVLQLNNNALDLYAHPPIEDAAEAQRLGTTIVEQLSYTNNMYRVALNVTIQQTEQDHFLPATP